MLQIFTDTSNLMISNHVTKQKMFFKKFDHMMGRRNGIISGEAAEKIPK